MLSSCEAEVIEASEGIKEASTGGVDVCKYETLRHRSQGGQQCGTRILPSTRSWTHEAHRFENLLASRLDCCGRCEIEEDTKDTQFGRHADAYTRCEGELEVLLPLMGLRCCSERDKELVATRQYKPVPIKVETRNDVVSQSLSGISGQAGVLAWLRVHVEMNQYSSHARHVASSTTLRTVTY